MKRIGVILIGVVMLGASGGALAEPATSFTAAGSCAFYAAGFLVDKARAQNLVPPEFPVLAIAGKALVFVAIMDCETSVDAGPLEPSLVSLVGVFTDPVGSPAGCQIYDLNWGENVAGPWTTIYSGLDIPVELQPNSQFVRTLGATDARVTGEIAPWSVTATTETVRAPLQLASVHCIVGSRGLVRATHQHADIVFTPAAGALVLGEGPLWTALAAESHSPWPGLSTSFDYTSVFEIIPLG